LLHEVSEMLHVFYPARKLERATMPGAVAILRQQREQSMSTTLLNVHMEKKIGDQPASFQQQREISPELRQTNSFAETMPETKGLALGFWQLHHRISCETIQKHFTNQVPRGVGRNCLIEKTEFARSSSFVS